MSATVIQFPARQAKAPAIDPLSRLAERVARTIADLPEADGESAVLDLLHAIDHKLDRLMQAQGGDL